MITPQMQTALDQMAKLEKDLQHSEANLRVLDRIGAPGTLELRSNNANARTKLAEMKAAIEEEMSRLPD